LVIKSLEIVRKNALRGDLNSSFGQCGDSDPIDLVVSGGRDRHELVSVN